MWFWFSSVADPFFLTWSRSGTLERTQGISIGNHLHRPSLTRPAINTKKAIASTEAFGYKFIACASHIDQAAMIPIWIWFLHSIPCVFGNFKPMSMLSVQHAKLGKLGRWKIWVLICFLTCPVIILQVQVVPCSRQPDGRQGAKSCGWQVSSEGRCRRSRGTITYGSLNPSGYRVVDISGNQFRVHRLVAHEFHGPPQGEAAREVNHVDGNRSNNRLDNLEWATPSQNVRHSYANLPRQSSIPSRHRPVLIRPIGSREWTRFSSVKLASEATGQPFNRLYARCSRNSQVDGHEYSMAPVQPAEGSGEEWRPMKCPRSGLIVEGRAVSSWGRVRSRRGHVFFGHLPKDGYFRTELTHRSQRRNELVHRLVAASFLGLPPSPEHSQVNHKDGNKSNNAVENLEYVTPAENIAHHFASLKGCNPLSKALLSRRFGTDEEWTRHPSVKSAADSLGLHRGCVSKCARGVRKQASGYEFRFAEPEAPAVETLPGEVWREVDLEAHLRDREKRRNRLPSHGWPQC